MATGLALSVLNLPLSDGSLGQNMIYLHNPPDSVDMRAERTSRPYLGGKRALNATTGTTAFPPSTWQIENAHRGHRGQRARVRTL
jgi:hypothetical protein